VRRLKEAGSRVSLFIEGDPAQVEAAVSVGAEVVELHTGAFCDAMREGGEVALHLDRLRFAAREAERSGLEVHAGHGIDYGTVSPIAAIPQVRELNIGHFLVGEAIFTGLAAAIGTMREQIDAATGWSGEDGPA
jgi:pyridoxine 5-phosphate synthase